jgi:calcium-dependent protein kinase
VSILHHLNGHANIVGLLNAYEGSKHIYIVMELCSGHPTPVIHTIPTL